MLFRSGVMLKIKSLDGKSVPQKLAEMKLEKDIILSKDIGISSLLEGRYNLEISGVDKANNTNKVSVNFDVYRKKDKNRLELLVAPTQYGGLRLGAAKPPQLLQMSKSG